MIRIIARISSNPGAAAQLRQILSDLVDLCRYEPGCLRYELFQDEESLLDFVTFEHRADQPATDAHMATDLLARPPIAHRFRLLA